MHPVFLISGYIVRSVLAYNTFTKYLRYVSVRCGYMISGLAVYVMFVSRAVVLKSEMIAHVTVLILDMAYQIKGGWYIEFVHIPPVSDTIYRCIASIQCVLVFLSCGITSKTKMTVVTEAWLRCEIDITMLYTYLSCFQSDLG